MINGEGADETSSEAALPAAINHISPCNSEKSYNGDESPVSSRYSSCGESEFERYCSANSVMGTPSLCGSVGTFQDYADSEFGSAKSFALSDVGSLESFNLGGGFIRKSGERKMSSSARSVSLLDDRTTTSEGMNSSDMIITTARQGSMEVKCNPNTDKDRPSKYESDHSGVCENSLSTVGRESELPGSLNKEHFFLQDGSGAVKQRDYSGSAVPINCSRRLSQSNYVEADVESTSSFGVNSDPYNLPPVEAQAQSQGKIRPFNSCLDELHGQTDEEIERRDVLKYSDEDKASSRFDYSEGEDSMFGGVTDDEKTIGSSHLRNMHYHQEARDQTENSFLLSSSVAFGSDDWVDWECNMTAAVPEEVETENLPLNSLRRDEVFSGNKSKQGAAIETPFDSNQLQDVYELGECIGNASLSPIDSLDSCEAELGRDPEDIFGTTNHVEYLSRLADHKLSSGSELSTEAVLNGGSDFMGNHLREDRPALCTQKIINQDSERIESEKLRLMFDTPSDVRASQLSSTSNIAPENRMVYLHRESGSLLLNNEISVERHPRESHESLTPYKEHADAVKVENLELHEFYNEVVHDMEEVLLDSTESPGARFKPDTANQFHFHLPLRDGGLTASTSGGADSYDVTQHSLTFDRVEVVGTKQKKGDVSFGERLVGVKKYTVYVIRVCSGNDTWEVERRYRDFCTLHRRLKTFFADKGWVLPSPWSMVEKESRKIFGSAAPDVVAERSTLIQMCLQSLLLSRFSSNLPSALIWFLGPPRFRTSSATSTQNPQSPLSSRHSDGDNLSTFGQTVSLIVELRPYKSMKQIQEAQQYTCAGCHKHFDDGKTRMVEFVQTLGWGKPRLCEYSGQLFCSSCHTNETSVLPARVLHHWDFTQYPVSQLAKSYLDSIYDQPMLCVSAVNPFLFSKVPALLQVMNVRKRIGTMLPFVRCPFRMSIHKGLASRRYLLESNDFFALKDLIDLSKGAFAALPAVIDAISMRIAEHITEQCLVCCDVGVPCNARQACNDPSSLIFPFQDGEIERCRSCKSVFHKRCFKKIGGTCPCQEPLDQGKERNGSDAATTQEVYRRQSSGSWDLFGRKSETKSTTMGFLSSLFTKARQESPSSPIQGDNVILMGSLPSTSL